MLHAVTDRFGDVTAGRTAQFFSTFCGPDAVAATVNAQFPATIGRLVGKLRLFST
jgi:hypothetical protein